jgi:predicted enzyme related to lactoylglutathione lyase
MVYTLFHKAGKQVAGLGQAQPGMPSVWNSFIYVDDVEAATAKVARNKGKVVVEPTDVLTSGRMSVVSDPTGAMVGLWEPREHQGWEAYGEPGAVVWNELVTRDVKKALPFYEKVVGWTWRTLPGAAGGADYYICQVGDKDNGGAFDMAGANLPAEIPPHWEVYIGVENADETVERAKRLGATHTAGPIDVPDVGRIQYLMDPTGAVVAVIQGSM